jgi:O-antigen ligase
VLFLGIGSSALQEMGRDASLTGRTEVWEVVLPFAVNPWVGAGFENFWIGERLQAIVRALGAGLNQAHNGYIEIYLNIGWVGLFLLVSLILCGYRNIMSSLRANPEMSGLKLAFFFICLVYNFTEAAFKIMSPVWLMFLWATMATPRSRRPAVVHAVSDAPAAYRFTTRGDLYTANAG